MLFNIFHFNFVAKDQKAFKLLGLLKKIARASATDPTTYTITST